MAVAVATFAVYAAQGSYAAPATSVTTCTALPATTQLDYVRPWK